MVLRHPESHRTATLFPFTALLRSHCGVPICTLRAPTHRSRNSTRLNPVRLKPPDGRREAPVGARQRRKVHDQYAESDCCSFEQGEEDTGSQTNDKLRT